jgi:nitrate/TMAO reductase-like tetraheme cytochrome c subunit
VTPQSLPPGGAGRSTLSLARHPVALVGAVITTASAILFLALGGGMALGLLANPYAGLLVFAALPAVFFAGLVLIPLGMRMERRRQRLRPDISPWPILDFASPRTRHVTGAVVVLTAVNLVIVLLAGYGTLQWMESPSFCGQVCHTPMHPQYTAWQNAPHAKVTCVQCHIGEGGSAFVHYKLAGLRQLAHVVTGDYPRPIPAPVDMRPAIETCGHCHWAGQALGTRLRVSHQYADDEANTETATAMVLHVGGPGAPTASGKAIHWHADPGVTIDYVASDDTRETIPWVRLTRPDGTTTEYSAEGARPDTLPEGFRKTMDCLDCHNVVAHRIATSAEEAVDAGITRGSIPRELPFVRREGVRVLRASYPTEDAALSTIDTALRDFYRARPAAADKGAVDRAVRGLQQAYQRNVFPTMRVTFGVYPDHLGHTTSTGCFRCHDGNHTAPDGTAISSDCETCHRVLDAVP